VAGEYDAVRVFHVGDHDSSGVHAYLSLQDDVTAFTQAYGGRVVFERIAVLPEHIERYGLVTAPPEPSDRRVSKGETVQAEALSPDVLAQIVAEAIERCFDPNIYSDVLRDEARERDALGEKLKHLGLES
jgi:hypothetical protein